MTKFLAVAAVVVPFWYPKAPDCVYTRYGCTYLIYYAGNGEGDVLMSCDGGARYWSYSGSVGGCPGAD